MVRLYSCRQTGKNGMRHYIAVDEITGTQRASMPIRWAIIGCRFGGWIGSPESVEKPLP